MRLINVDTLALEEFHDKTQTPPYAVLSHTWGTQEVSFEDWRRVKRASRKKGYDKIIATCSQAKRDGLRYVWVDTNCINKTSSSELSEAINSMFDWYRGADVCYAYLDDVEDKADGDEWLEGNPFYDSFHRSRWFSRGWTLQELLAPKKLVCYSKGWTRLGTRHDLSYRISKVTKIDELFLYDTANLQIFTASIAKRMSWASSRRTTREEDMAYCLLGLFEVNMPLLYGEGRRAFVRLQEEIMKRSVDQSLFAWSFPTREDAWEHITQSTTSTTLLAWRPKYFSDSADIGPVTHGLDLRNEHRHGRQFSVTNIGLAISLRLVETISANLYVGVLTCGNRNMWVEQRGCVGIPLVSIGGRFCFARATFPLGPLHIHRDIDETPTQIYVEGQSALYRPLASAGQIVTSADCVFMILFPCGKRGFRLCTSTENFGIKYFKGQSILTVERGSSSARVILTFFNMEDLSYFSILVGVDVRDRGVPIQFCKIVEFNRFQSKRQLLYKTSSPGSSSSGSCMESFMRATHARSVPPVSDSQLLISAMSYFSARNDKTLKNMVRANDPTSIKDPHIDSFKEHGAENRELVISLDVLPQPEFSGPSYAVPLYIEPPEPRLKRRRQTFPKTLIPRIRERKNSEK